MKTRVCLGEQSYDIILERGVHKRAGALLELDRKVLIVTDSGVPATYAQTVAAQCKEAYVVTVPMGEGSKSLACCTSLLSEMLKQGFSRKDCVVAVGGGVVGDLAGFAASCYMRGVDFYNLPTTLLSAVDSSIGGKTAVNFEGVKNIVGSFYQPKCVLMDPDTLNTLDERQLHAGIAEVIKMAATCDGALFERIEQSRTLLPELPEIIWSALEIKRKVVEQDPREGGLRRILNFGHTIGHAIEGAKEHELLHGECVALGMLPFCAPEVRPRVKAVLQKYNLPTAVELTAEELKPYLLHDKKMESDSVTVVLVDRIGTCRMEKMRVEDILLRLECLQ